MKKKGRATLEVADGAKLLDEAEDDGLELGDKGLLLLANDNMETGEYQSESNSEEVDEEQSEDEESPVEAVSRKRKATTNLQNVKLVLFCVHFVMIVSLSILL